MCRKDWAVACLKRAKRSAKIRLSRFGSAAADAVARWILPGADRAPLRYDFAYGRSDIETFPFEMWRRILLRHARMAPVRAI